MSITRLKTWVWGAWIVLILLLAYATVYEKIHDTPQVHERIYGTGWFVSCWGIAGLLSLLYLFRRRLYRQKVVFLLHISLGLILLGAFTTWVSADRGYLHLRQAEVYTSYLSEEEEEIPLPFEVKLVLFDIQYHPGTNDPADFISYLRVNGEICQVSMNKIHREQGYRFYQYSYDPDEMGSILLVNHDPWGIGITYTGYLLLAVCMIWILFLRIGWKGVLITTLSVAALWFYISQLNPMTPILRSPMLAAHVSVIMISYLLLIVMFILAIVGISGDYSNKMSRQLYRINSLLLFPAVFLLAAGIFIGAVWANISWGRYWGWDAKETWALITLLVYAFPFHKGSLSWFAHPRNFQVYCILAALTVAMTFFGVTYILGGIHSYV